VPEETATHWQRALLERHRLDGAYLESARAWFDPLARSLAARQRLADRPLLVGLNGCQGSGKTTLCDYLCCALGQEYALPAIALSLDDFYLTRDERRALASSVHPLLATRGVPGTHDMGLLRSTLAALLDDSGSGTALIPRFDKAADDRVPLTGWTRVGLPVQVVLLEGWCLGARPEPDSLRDDPVNALERDEDPGGRWRAYVNATLEREFLPLYALVDQWVMLHAPSFDCVFDWRREQERKLAATLPSERAAGLMSDAALRRFIQHYERLTRQCLNELPDRVDHLFWLDRERRITGYRRGAGATLPP